MRIINQGAVELRTGSNGSVVLEWLFSNLVVARKDGDVFVPLKEDDASDSPGEVKVGGVAKVGGDDVPNSVGAWELQM